MKKILLIFTLFSATSIYAQTASNYQGSSFLEILQVLSNQRVKLETVRQKQEFNFYSNGTIPHYPVNLATVFSSETGLRRDAKRTLSDSSDYYSYLPKRIHANGICLTGEWNITNNSGYTGYFKKGARGLFVGRASVTMEGVGRNDKRGFGFAGKIFPTLNVHETVKTLNFFTADILMGEYTDRFLEATMTNEPDSGFNLPVLVLGYQILKTFKMVDENPMFRPVNHIAQQGTDSPRLAPRGIRISANQKLQKNDYSDFRAEIIQALKVNKNLIFNIDVARSNAKRDSTEWTRIGYIAINNAVVSYGCDRQLHFAHPSLR